MVVGNMSHVDKIFQSVSCEQAFDDTVVAVKA